MARQRNHRDVTQRENPYGQIPDDEEYDDDFDAEADDFDSNDDYDDEPGRLVPPGNETAGGVGMLDVIFHGNR